MCCGASPLTRTECVGCHRRSDRHGGSVETACSPARCATRAMRSSGRRHFERRRRPSVAERRPLAPSGSQARRAFARRALVGLVDPGGWSARRCRGPWPRRSTSGSIPRSVMLNPPGAIRRGMTTRRCTPCVAIRARCAPRGDLDRRRIRRSRISVVEALRAGGRLIAPVSVAVPAGMRELARDAESWVANAWRSSTRCRWCYGELEVGR